MVLCAFSRSNLLNWYSRLGGLPTKLQGVLGHKFESRARLYSAVCAVVYISYQLCTQRLASINAADKQRSSVECIPLFKNVQSSILNYKIQKGYKAALLPDMQIETDKYAKPQIFLCPSGKIHYCRFKVIERS